MSTDPTQPSPPRIVAKAARPRPKAGGPEAAPMPTSAAPGGGQLPGQPGQSVPAGAANPFAPPATQSDPSFPPQPAHAPEAAAPPHPGVPGPSGHAGQPAPDPNLPPAGLPGQAPEATEVLAASAPAQAAGAVGAGAAADAAMDATAVSTTDAAALERARAERAARIEQAEAERQQRMAAQAERARRLGTVTPDAAADSGASIRTVVTRNTDKFAGSLGLFLLRVVTALVVGVHGFNQLVTINETSALIKSLALPSALQSSSTALAWVYAGGGVLAAVLLIFGFLTRFAGLLVTVGAVASLAFVQWGNFQIFVGNGFLGERELLLVGIGLMFFLVGAGGWALDAGFRRSRAERRTS